MSPSPDNPHNPAPNDPPEPFMSWFKRQVAYVKEALETDAHGNPLPQKDPAADAAANPAAIYRKTRVEEQPLPRDPSLKLRRTVIDEVIPAPASPEKPQPPNSNPSGNSAPSPTSGDSPG